jgi:hypothetical protein
MVALKAQSVRAGHDTTFILFGEKVFREDMSMEKLQALFPLTWSERVSHRASQALGAVGDDILEDLAVVVDRLTSLCDGPDEWAASLSADATASHIVTVAHESLTIPVRPKTFEKEIANLQSALPFFIRVEKTTAKTRETEREREREIDR